MSIHVAHEVPAAEYRSRRAYRSPAAFSRRWAITLVAVDLVMFVISAYTATALGLSHWERLKLRQEAFLSDAICIALWVILFARLGLYKRSFALSVKDEFYFTVAALALGIVPLFTLFTIVPAISTSRLVLILLLLFTIFTVGSARAIVHGLRVNAMKRRPRRLAIVGRSDEIRQASEALSAVDGTQWLHIAVENLDETLPKINLTKDVNLDSIEWFRTAKQWKCDTLVLTEMLPPFVMPHILEVAGRSQIRFAFAPPRFERHSYQLSLQTDGRQALILPTVLKACTPRARLVKRAFDVVFASLATVFVSPVLLCAAAAIWLETGGPLLYRQERVGRSGAVFSIFKFRSMRQEAEGSTGPVWARQDDDRRTRVGTFLRRFSIDELPQLLNVLRGDMSLVGPRPERPVFVERFRNQLARYDERHLVRPGITGWSQVHMKRTLEPSDIADKLACDLFYVEEWSIFMDVSVLIKTAAEVLFHRAA